jgi:ABC-type branched-subunit amino acid transport system ATPase component
VTILLKAENISRSFGGLKALDVCNLEVEKGSITGLIGPNGSGKTTLFNVMTGYVRPDSFQLTRIFARMTVLENMLVATQHDESWIKGLTRSKSSTVDIDNAMEWLTFVGIARLAELQAGSLSYGQRKLLELAYVLVADPDVILLDEPAGGVNLTLINQIADKIRALNEQGKTFLIVEHNMEFVMGLCNVVTVMNQGSNLVSGLPGDIRSNPLVLDAYLGDDDDESEEVVNG